VLLLPHISFYSLLVFLLLFFFPCSIFFTYFSFSLFPLPILLTRFYFNFLLLLLLSLYSIILHLVRFVLSHFSFLRVRNYTNCSFHLLLHTPRSFLHFSEYTHAVFLAVGPLLFTERDLSVYLPISWYQLPFYYYLKNFYFQSFPYHSEVTPVPPYSSHLWRLSPLRAQHSHP
jgi:hypothetical protein